MIVMRIIHMGATEVLGEKFGAIFATVAGMIAMSAGNSLLAGQSMTTMWNSMMSASNLLQLTNAVGNGVAGYIQASAVQYTAEGQKVLENYNKESTAIKDLYAQNIGYGNGIIDPMNFTNFVWESESSFLTRTLLTGSDIAEMSMDMITDFSSTTLDLNYGR
jgi:hypothetical protein